MSQYLYILTSFTQEHLLAESLFFKKITNYIIPAIAHLMREEPLTMSRLASEAFMVEGGKIDVDCTDLRETDEFFQNFALM